MPTLETFEVYARRVEEEIPHNHKKDTTAKTKKCPICNHENPLGAAHCTGCGHEFPKAGPKIKPCASCGMPNSLGAKICTSCGKPFTTDFNLKLDEALRTGAIIRGMDITESEVLEAEKMATHVRKAILQSGDARLIKLLQVMPEEILGHLKQILDAKGA